MTDSARIDLIYSLFTCDTIQPSAPMSLFFAGSFIADFGEKPTPVLTIPELCRTLALPIGQSRKAISDLIHMGLLSRTKQNWASQPSYIFQMNFSSFLDKCPPRTPSTRCQEMRALQILEWGSTRPQDRTHQLRIPLRTLLLMLLAHASPTGVVQGLGHSQLAKRTGQTRRQVRDHLNKLMRYKYICQVVEGGNFDGVLGRKKSVYLLNMRHASYSEAKDEGFTAIFDPIVDTPIADAVHASNANFHANQKTCNMLGVKPLMELATSPIRGPAVAQLRWIVAELASEVLNEYAQALVPKEPYLSTCSDASRIPEPCILDTFERSDGLLPISKKDSKDHSPSDFFVHQVRNLCSNPFSADLNEITLDSESARDNLKLFLTACAIHRAMLAAIALSGIPDIEVHDYRYLIFPIRPTRKSNRLLTIEAFPRQCKGEEHIFYQGNTGLRDRHRPDCTVSVTKPTNNPDQQLLDAAGLRTLPLEKPTLTPAPE